MKRTHKTILVLLTGLVLLTVLSFIIIKMQKKEREPHEDTFVIPEEADSLCFSKPVFINHPIHFHPGTN